VAVSESREFLRGELGAVIGPGEREVNNRNRLDFSLLLSFHHGKESKKKRGKIQFLNLLINNEFVTTDTELNAIAAPAMIGLSRNPVKGYRIPAAIGIPSVL